ncbi:MAG: PEP/pyruvate-binding domain-containing protein [Candidatus Omnitrophica bacterium]|nr:PEP/pyruvate-binding domain-containing protein [Candidatus Omnitrophota bacterium]
MATTGVKGLDEIITQLRTGDNVVWQIDEIQDYRDFVAPYVASAIETGKRIVYIRFAEHDPVIEPHEKIEIYNLDGHSGFESFSSHINDIITKEGRGVYYVFDCLSDLLLKWATDLMIGNFFMITCPYLFELDTIAYFSIIRNRHSFKTIARIRETTQLLIDVFNRGNKCYVHPLKVWNRYSPTMFLPHMEKDGKFIPISDSVRTAKLFSSIGSWKAESAVRTLDYWDRLFLEAEDLLESPFPGKKKKMAKELCRIMLAKDERMVTLVENNFELEDLIEIKSRLVGTGFIGGKTVGMLLARKILSKDPSVKWAHYSEAHDSFYVGSDVFYTYIIQNGLWKLRMEQKKEEGYFHAAKVLEKEILKGRFPEEIVEQFQQIIDYFGQSPIIIRSSSLLEDAFGNAFAGKYESYFVANQGSPDERYEQFVEAVKKVYASTMSEEALAYRLQRGLDQADEQMALLIQRVSGAHHNNYFFPDLAGVGVSFNPYVWSDEMDPKAGMLRLVFGLGTRAVNRTEGDYARVVALDKPLLRPQMSAEKIREFSQKGVDLIDINKNHITTVPFMELIKENIEIKINKIAVLDEEAMKMLRALNKNEDYWILTFDDFVSKGDFVQVMNKILKTLEKNYNYPVDIEFTINFIDHDKYKINIVQCRPLQTIGIGGRVRIPENIPKENIVFKSNGGFLGGNILQGIKRIVYIDPEEYISLSVSEKTNIARTIGKINNDIKKNNNLPTFLMGPGRWGTSTPSLGVPIAFGEINNFKILGEIAFPKGGLMPDLSFGAHFFQDLVETGIFYVSIFPDEENVILNKEWILSMPNKLATVVPAANKYEKVIKVIDADDKHISMISDIISQKVICFID